MTVSSKRILPLDTDVASRLQVGKLRSDYRDLAETYDFYAISFISEAEWRTGLRLKENAKRQARFDEWMKRVIRLSVDDEVTLRYSELAAVAMQRNESVKYRQNDTWIAAIAVRHDLPLMTEDRGHYKVFAEHGGLRLEPPL